MAMQIEVSQSTYSKIENGSQKLTFEMLQKIAKVLGISTHYLTQKEPLVVL
ncbi:MAG: helix-turn-helix domain-containing protein [Capnocytophaga gingivalis]